MYSIHCFRKLRGFIDAALADHRGAGFVGSHLTEELLRRGDEMFVIDDLSTGRIDNIETRVIAHFSHSEEPEFTAGRKTA